MVLKKICNNCEYFIDIDEEECKICGGRSFRGKEFDLSQYEDAKGIVGYFTQFFDMVDNGVRYLPLIHTWKSQEPLSLKMALFKDILQFLGYLSICDDSLTDEEVDLINYVLNSSYSKAGILGLLKSNLSKSFKNELPVSFIFFHEIDEDAKSNLMNFPEKFVDYLLILYKTLGEMIITCDGEANFIEISYYREYMKNLERNLEHFKEYGYEKMVKSIPKEQ